ncbi:MAG: hypothetical protein ACRCVK_08375 [Aeromonas veronii]
MPRAGREKQIYRRQRRRYRRSVREAKGNGYALRASLGEIEREVLHTWRRLRQLARDHQAIRLELETQRLPYEISVSNPQIRRLLMGAFPQESPGGSDNLNNGGRGAPSEKETEQ